MNIAVWAVFNMVRVELSETVIPSSKGNELD